MAKFTRPIGMKFRETDFNRVQSLAERDEKRIGEWCRDRILEFLAHPAPTPVEQALMAEISATRAITINLMFALATNAKLTREGVQQVVDAAHTAKYKDAGELLRQAFTRTQPRRVEPTNAASSQAGGRR